MNIYAEPGTKVTFSGKGGYEEQQKQARRMLQIGATYEVFRIDVASWSSQVWLKGIEHPFNTVMFDDKP